MGAILVWLHFLPHWEQAPDQGLKLACFCTAPAIRRFGANLISAAQAFSSGQEFLSSDYLDETRCLILDVAMPGMSGLDVQGELKRRGQAIPTVENSGRAYGLYRIALFGRSSYCLKAWQ